MGGKKLDDSIRRIYVGEPNQGRVVKMVAPYEKLSASQISQREETHRKVSILLQGLDGPEDGEIFFTKKGIPVFPSGRLRQMLTEFIDAAQVVAQSKMSTVLSGKLYEEGPEVIIKILPKPYRDKKLGYVDALAVEAGMTLEANINPAYLIHAPAVLALVQSVNQSVIGLVLEYLQGETLAKKMKREPIEPKEAISIAKTIAISLLYLHANEDAAKKGIKKVDLTPGNVFIENNGHIRLIDYGLARRRGKFAFEREGVCAGTINYVAPEMIESGADAISEKSDMYSLGVMLFEMIEGQIPYEIKNPSLPALMLAKVKGPTLKMEHPSAPDGLPELVEKMLDKKPENRPLAVEVVNVFEQMERNLTFYEIGLESTT